MGGVVNRFIDTKLGEKRPIIRTAWIPFTSGLPAALTSCSIVKTMTREYKQRGAGEGPRSINLIHGFPTNVVMA